MLYKPNYFHIEIGTL